MVALPNDPKTGKPLQGEDKTAEFERVSRQAPRDPEAERAFIQAKVELIRADPRLSDEEKAKAIAELRARCKSTYLEFARRKGEVMLAVALPTPNEIAPINAPFFVVGGTDLTNLQEVTVQAIGELQ